MRLRFKKEFEQQQSIDIGHGEYRREFRKADEPFEASDEEAALLLSTGVFEEQPQEEAAEAPAAEAGAGQAADPAGGPAKAAQRRRSGAK